jgi:hypothetical protein
VQWLVAWMILGHRPDPSFDYPESIHGLDWINKITQFAILIGIMPVSLLALGLNIAHIAVNRPGLFRAIVRLGVFLSILAGMFALMVFDPGRIFEWGI